MIHELILEKTRAELQTALIDSISTSDPARAGVVKIGPLQGDPDPDVARISITIHENDPDIIAESSTKYWDDEPEEIEIPGAITYRRRFCVKGRCLLEGSRETLTEARHVASLVRQRLERSLLKIDFSGLESDGEYVSRGILGQEDFNGNMLQSGGPPDAYDFIIKLRFSLLTTWRLE